jgi:hypothetical protein
LKHFDAEHNSRFSVYLHSTVVTQKKTFISQLFSEAFVLTLQAEKNVFGTSRILKG